MSLTTSGHHTSARTWISVFVIALHAIVLYVMFASSWFTFVTGPMVLHVRLLESQKRPENTPPPVSVENSIPENVIVSVPQLNIAIAKAPPSEDIIDDVIEIPHHLDQFSSTRQVSGVATRPRPYSMRHGIDYYPEESIKARESGRPVLNICVSAVGEVTSVTVAKTSGFPRLDQAAIKMGRDYRFKPALLHGKAVPDCVRYGITFDLGILPHAQQHESESESSGDAGQMPSSPAADSQNVNIGPLLSPVPIQTYLDTFAHYGISCNAMQLRVIGQDVHDHRYVIEAQCAEQPGGLVAFLPLAGNSGKLEIMDCSDAAKRQINCEFNTG